LHPVTAIYDLKYGETEVAQGNYIQSDNYDYLLNSVDITKIMVVNYVPQHAEDVDSSVQVKLESLCMKGWGYPWIVLSCVLQMRFLLALRASQRPT